MRCLRKSCMLIWIAPANKRKFSMAPIITSVKLTLAKMPENLLTSSGYDRPAATMVTDTTMAMSMMPMVDGSFKNRRFKNENTAAKTIRIEKV